jgi:hypothetical protein
MPDRPDDMIRGSDLEATLTELGGALAWSRPGPAFAETVRSRIEALPVPGEAASRGWRGWRGWLAAPGGRRPVRRSLLLAVALLLVAATVVAAIGLGLPGIRILFFGPAPTPTVGLGPTPTPSVGAPLGSSLGIGVALPLDEAGALVGFEPRLPSGAEVGPPEAVFVSAGRLTMVWPASPTLPEIEGAPGIGLLVTELRGRVDEGAIDKQIFEGGVVEDVRFGDGPAFWLTGPPHGLVYRDATGAYIQESRRMVGDVLIWRDGDLTMRLETSLGLEEALRIAESIR